MRRSEMLNIIKDSLYCHLPGYKECPDFIAETVLQAIENTGMEPPPIRDILVNPLQVDPYWKSNSWEPEND